MSGRIPLRIEATIDALTDTVATRGWAWAGDTALAAHDLLRWRDHRDVITLTSPADRYDPDALAAALGHTSRSPTGPRYRGCAVIPVDAGDHQHLAVLRSYPDATSGPRWDQLTCLAHPHRRSRPQRTTNRALTASDVIDRWARSQFELGATIDALTLADHLGPEPFLRGCDHLPGPVLERARTTLTELTDTPDRRLELMLTPEDQASARLAATRLTQTMRSRGRHR